MKPNQLELIVTLSAPTLTPDGARAVVAATRPSLDADAYVGQLWEVHIDDSAAPRRITAGTNDTDPQFSPNGALLAFLRRVDGTPQLAIVDAQGGEPQVITNAPLGVRSFVWDRDSKTLAFVAAIPEEGRYGTLEGVPASKEDARRVTGNKYKMNGRGYVADQRLGVYVVTVPGLHEEPWIEPVGRAAREAKEDGDEAKNPTPGVVLGGEKGLPVALLVSPLGADAYDPEFSPDGRWVYFTAALHASQDDDLRTSVHRVKAPTVEPSFEAAEYEVPSPELVADAADVAFGSPAFSGDGSLLYLMGTCLGETGRDFVARQAAIFSLDAEKLGGKKLQAPTELTDPVVVDYTPTVRLVPHGEKHVAAIARVRGAGELHSISPEGKTRVLLGGSRVVQGAAFAGRTLVVTYTDAVSPGELGLVERINGQGVLRALTSFAAPLNRETVTSTPRELTVKSSDGYPVHGWVFTPEGKGPHPVLLNIHGGPFAEYTPAWFDEAQVYVQAGYAVVQCNPRGSASYGREHGLAIKEAMGTLDFQDVIAFLDGALKKDKSLDKNRLGILGGSYGGYLTAWTIAHDQRFKAAIVERGYLDPESFVGTSDIGWFFSPEYVGEDPEKVRAQSPMAFVDEVRTPTLVVHSEQDWRCPIEQAQRYFARLKANGVETEMLIFPGENHELSRSGTPWHRVQRFEAMLEWFGRYLPVR